MGAPAKGTEDVTGVPAHGCEGCVDSWASDGVIYDVEPKAICESANVVFNRAGAVVDWSCAEAFDEMFFGRRDGSEHLGSEGTGDLDRHVADAAGALDEYRLARTDPGAVDQTLPGGDDDEWTCGSFARNLGAAIASADNTNPNAVIRAEDPTGRKAAGKAGRDITDEVSSCLHGTSCDFTACHKLRPGGV